MGKMEFPLLFCSSRFCTASSLALLLCPQNSRQREVFYTIHFCAARLPPSTEFAGFEKYPKLPVIDVILKKGSCQNHGTNSVTNSVYKQEHHLLHRNFIFFFADPFCGPFSAGIPAILTSQQKPYHFSSFRDLDDLCSIKHSGKNGESLGFWLS